MRPRLSFVALVLAVIGLGASVASLVDYLAAVPTFCAESGCATVRASAWAHPLGVPMPVPGIAFFAVMIALALVEWPRLRLGLALAGGAWAIVLIGLQAFAIGAWCKLCMIADPAAVALAVVVAAGACSVRWKRAVLAIPALALPLAFAGLAHAPDPELAAGTPELIAREQVRGSVTIVEFVDFECPFCRQLAPRLADAVEHARAPVHVVRKMVPLRQHPHARDAALAWCCADAKGKGDAMARALFAAPPDELTPDGCERLAVQVGCDRDRYRAALADAAVRVDRDIADAKAAGIHGFPTVFIGGQRVTGAGHDASELRAAIDRAL
jgi:protein-disulfide isomerase/uncharacterized membrane protein